MKIKNKDGTVNSLPIMIIVSVIIVVTYSLLFGFDIKEEVDTIMTDSKISTTKAIEKTTIKLCNNCSMRFKEVSFDVSTNGTVDVAELLSLDKIGLRNVTFDVSDPNLITIEPYSNTFLLTTGNQEGTAIIYATYGDITAETTINIIHPSKANVKFEYDYYFVAYKNRIEANIVTYPLGYNTNDIKFYTNDKTIVGISSKRPTITGKDYGEGTVYLNIGNITSEAKVYVVPNLITVKVQNGDKYQEARSITPIGDSFQLMITFTDSQHANYDNKNLSVSFENQGILAQSAYVGKGSEANSYIYQVDISGTGKAIMRVELSDGSYTLFEINR